MWEHSEALIRVIQYPLLHNTTSQENPFLREKTVVSWTQQESSVVSPSRAKVTTPMYFDLLPLHCFTDHLCPPSSPLGRSTTLHLKFGTVSGHPQDRRTLSVVLGVA